MKPKYVTYGHGKECPMMYVIITNHTSHGYWKVEISPCDWRGSPVSDPIAWDIFPSWWEAYKYRHKLYKEFTAYVNRKQ